MSLSDESLIGDLVYVIEGSLDLDYSTELEVGSAVIYQDWYYDKRDDNISIMIKYKRTDNEECWSAIETYFVTEDVWIGLKKFFTEGK